MRASWTLARLALSIMIAHWRAALRATAPPIALMSLAGVAFAWSVPTEQAAREAFVAEAGLRFWLLFAALIAFQFAMIAYAAVPWHRAVLAGRGDDCGPSSIAWRRYAIRLSATTVVMLIFMLFLALPMFIGVLTALEPWILESGDDGLLTQGVIIATTMLLGAVFGTYFLRICVALPALALGEAMTVTAIMERTRERHGLFWILGPANMALLSVSSAPAAALAAYPLAAGLVGFLGSWLAILFELALLSVLYDHILRDGRLARLHDAPRLSPAPS